LTDETLANFNKPSTQAKAKKKRGPKSSEPKEQIAKVVTKVLRNKSCWGTPTSCKKHIRKGFDEEYELQSRCR
jgi:hypothetical protein